jgi:hypothetical protein
MLVWTLRIVGFITMLVCLVCCISYPGTDIPFKVALGVGGLLILQPLIVAGSTWLWVICNLSMYAMAYMAINHVPKDIPGVALEHLGWYPGVLLGLTAFITTIVLLKAWGEWREARAMRSRMHGSAVGRMLGF